MVKTSIHTCIIISYKLKIHKNTIIRTTFMMCFFCVCACSTVDTGLDWHEGEQMILRRTITLTYSLRNPRCSCSGFLPRRSRHWSEPWGRWRRKFWPWARCAPAKDKPTPPSRCAPSTSYESETEKICYLCTRDLSNVFVLLSAKPSVWKAAEAVTTLSMCLPFMSVNARHCSFC